jgi:predicted ArsR family transcriptional regulator
MARGRRTRIRLALTEEERLELERWQRTLSTPAGQVRRARIVLLLAGGMPVTQVAQTVGISRKFVYKWVQRFQAGGVAGLASRRSTGRPRQTRAVVY